MVVGWAGWSGQPEKHANSRAKSAARRRNRTPRWSAERRARLAGRARAERRETTMWRRSALHPLGMAGGEKEDGPTPGRPNNRGDRVRLLLFIAGERNARCRTFRRHARA